MSVRNPRRGAHRAVAVLAGFCLAGGPLLAGCDSFKQAIGIDKVAPDEFSVENQPPLTIPPDFALRPPKPGAPRPQQAKSDVAARHIFEAAGPAKPEENSDAAAIERAAARLAQLGINPTAVDPNGAVEKGSLAAKLLTYSGSGGAAVEKRDTEALKGVY
ncbi:MAG TPA: DUF3035 domain-containing protein [Stellaceae bacterium]|nr:DUF3035 domain-containing protein [Stellaceae bacterium]